MKQLILIGILVSLVCPISAQEPLQEGDQIASLLDGSGWVILHHDMTWEASSYDELMKLLGGPGDIGIEEAPKVRSWRYYSDVDPITDIQGHLYVTDATNHPNRDDTSLAFRIYIREDGRIWISINWNTFLGQKAITTCRIDKEPSYNEWWELSNDKQVAFFPGDEKAFIRKLLTSQQFIARITPYSENTITAIFDVSGVREFLTEHPELLKILEESQSTGQ